MTIYSALYFPGSLAKDDLIIRDNRFYSGKYAETLPVWLSYVRRHYPKARLVLFADESSPVPIAPLLDAHLREPWIEEFSDKTRQWEWHDADGSGDGPLVHIKWVNQFAGQYFRPMQRNLVEAMKDAYAENEDLLWIDADCFANTDVTPLLVDVDFAAASIEAHQMTAASVFTYISAHRLHAYDRFCPLPDYLTKMVNDAPVDTRMHSLQEGGLYKLFCFGRTRDLGAHLDLAHLSCHSHFMRFLRENPLDSDDYADLVEDLDSLVKQATGGGHLDGVDMEFHDMLFSTKGGPSS